MLWSGVAYRALSLAVAGTMLMAGAVSGAQESSASEGAPPVEAAAVPPVDAALQAILTEIDTNMVPVKAGSFLMGDIGGRGLPDEKPLHRVEVAAFQLSKYEVTFLQFDAYTRAAGKPRVGDQGLPRGNYPVINVNWAEAQEFIAWLNLQTGLSYRLPSEAEWEYAARAGSAADYPWGPNYDASKANGSGTSDADPYRYTGPVGAFAANAWGIYDMVGNVWEWVQDCYLDSYEGASKTADPVVVDTGGCNPVIRGGSWANDPANLRVSDRSWYAPQYRYHYLGFRLARD